MASNLFLCFAVVAAVCLPTIEPNVIPLEAAFQGKAEILSSCFSAKSYKLLRGTIAKFIA